MIRRIPQQAIDFIKEREELRLVVYSDQAGYPTVGWGCRVNMPVGMRMRLEFCQGLLQEKMMDVSNTIFHELDGEEHVLNDNQYSAILSFVFNTGTLGATLTAELKEGQYDLVPAAFRMWVWITDPVSKIKRISKGLVNRREAEIELWSKPV